MCFSPSKLARGTLASHTAFLIAQASEDDRGDDAMDTSVAASPSVPLVTVTTDQWGIQLDDVSHGAQPQKEEDQDCSSQSSHGTEDETEERETNTTN